MRNLLLIILLGAFSNLTYGQIGENAFTFLNLPLSARSSALGGKNVSLIEPDASLIFNNPGLLGSEMDGLVSLYYMNYISDINIGSALYTKAIGDHSAWGVGLSFFGYGQFDARTIDDEQMGTFSANDLALHGFYAHDLSDRWRIGVSMQFLYSSFDQYTSYGLAADAGLSYYNRETGFSAGFSLQNVGAQLKAYEEERMNLPFDLQMGFSKRMSSAPLRFSFTAVQLTEWNFDYTNELDPTYEGDSFTKKVLKHLVFGIDFIPSDNFWLGVGFNGKTNSDMRLESGNTFGGFTAGCGIKIKTFDVGVAFAKYHPSAMSMSLNISMRLEDLKK